MGNCLAAFRRKDGAYEPYTGGKGPSEEKLVSTWKQTGIVGLRDRGLKELPACVALVAGDAKVLDATNNKLTAFPVQLQHLVNLQRLIIASNGIVEISGSVLVPLAASLKILVLDSNKIGVLPDEIGLLTKLEKLSLKNNALTEINPAVGQCVTLQFLNVSQNQLSALPLDLEGCEALEELDASGNTLTVIPTSLGKLQRLKTLNLDNNGVMQVCHACMAA